MPNPFTPQPDAANTQDTSPKDTPISERVKFLAERLSVPIRHDMPDGYDPDDFIRAIERVFELQNRAQDELEAWESDLFKRAKDVAEREAKVALRERKVSGLERIERIMSPAREHSHAPEPVVTPPAGTQQSNERASYWQRMR